MDFWDTKYDHDPCCLCICFSFTVCHLCLRLSFVCCSLRLSLSIYKYLSACVCVLVCISLIPTHTYIYIYNMPLIMMSSEGKSSSSIFPVFGVDLAKLAEKHVEAHNLPLCVLELSKYILEHGTTLYRLPWVY